MSVTVEIVKDETTLFNHDGTDELGNEVRYWYELHDSGALVIKMHKISPGGSGMTTVDVIYGPTHWVSVSGDDRLPGPHG